jgi:O-antigen/teichoic acid export membrane protein
MKWVNQGVFHAGAQGVSQVAALVTGILVVRGLDKPEYAAYSLVVWMLASVSVVADAGIGAVLMSAGQSVREDQPALARLFGAAWRYRLFIGGSAALLGAGWVTLVLWQSGVNTFELALAVGGMIIAMIPTLSIGIAQTYHRVKLDTRRLRLAMWMPPIVRLALIVVLVCVGWLSLATAIGVTVIVAALTLVLLTVRTDGLLSRPKSLVRDSAFGAAIARALPMAVLLVLTEQTLYSVILLRGSTDQLAEFSALSRFGLMFAIVNPVVADIVAPLIARSVNIRSIVIRKVLLVASIYLVSVLAFTFLVWASSPLLLALLGPGYEGLNRALVIICFSFGLAYFGHAMNYVTQSRGWVAGSWVYMPAALVWATYAIWFADLSTAEDAAWLFLAQVLLALIAQATRIVIGAGRTPPR